MQRIHQTTGREPHSPGFMGSGCHGKALTAALRPASQAINLSQPQVEVVGIRHVISPSTSTSFAAITPSTGPSTSDNRICSTAPRTSTIRCRSESPRRAWPTARRRLYTPAARGRGSASPAPITELDRATIKIADRTDGSAIFLEEVLTTPM